MGVGDGFGAEVINIKGWGAELDSCGLAPQADKMITETKNKIKRGLDDFMREFGRCNKFGMVILTKMKHPKIVVLCLYSHLLYC